VISDGYAWIREGAVLGAKPEMLPTFEDGYRSNCIVDAMLRSHAAGGAWEKVQYVPGDNDTKERGTVA
jgi:hypothetical protein